MNRCSRQQVSLQYRIHIMHFRYILITPARNEEEHIEGVIKSVTSQTHLPEKWVIVSDGSTDGTDALVKKHLPNHSWMEFMRMPEHEDRQFASKVHCFNAGYAKVRHTEHDIVGNLDADITFERDYFEYLMSKFADDPGLGVAGTPFVEDGKHYDYRYTNIEHVSGACQLFRRECFEEIGGYVPIKGGGIDWAAVTTARMRGWKTRTYTDKTCRHHRKMGTGNTSPILTWFRQGRKDYFLGNHPVWELFRTVYQMSRKPYCLGGSLLLTGYLWAAVRNKERPISRELLVFVRKEQMHRLTRALTRL